MNDTTDLFADDFASRDQMHERLQNETEVFKNPRVRDAFEAVDRQDFVEDDYKLEAYEDYPLPIAEGQSISQPTTVAFMLELLHPKEGDIILDVGSGSGYTTALLAHMTGKTGKVVGLEVEEALVLFGEKNLAKYEFPWAEIRRSQGGVPDLPEAPFDRILVSAGAREILQELVDALQEGGVMVLPVSDPDGGHTIVRFQKEKEDEEGREKAQIQKYPGFSFVPFRD